MGRGTKPESRTGAGRTAGRAAALVLLAGALLASVGALRALSDARASADAPPRPGRSAAYYERYGTEALSLGDPARALAAARLETAADPGSAAAWTRLAYAATLAAGAPTREALLALDRSFAAQPFPPAERQAWRVAYAEANWPAIPDPLAAKVLSQVASLGAAGAQWDARIAWCAGSRVPAIAEAACATTPGVEQGIWLKTEERGGDQ